MIILRGNPFIQIDLGGKDLSQVFRQTIGEMHRQPVFFLRIQNIYLFRFGNQPTAITYLSPALSIERCYIEYQLIKRLPFRTHPAIACNLYFRFRVIISHELLRVV